ncbi:tRNA-uridine aminocarboxypropyltransferase [Nannocystis punicea]|uniref:tRNA-uridine aminocarboxypropyltransferase n=1 Tax=Nannocystis punicea TaxID=2995304 RepID=A0ABY7GSH3_9BACT|nr:tRNA-uridine aminocarboxypropyltransferase [Nannocystis poenicansa]WAS89910.1 DTW domain-containing protein [Nannocystis poenicansa]
MEPRAHCPQCRRPRQVCWCDALVPVPSRTRVVFLQHPREFRVGVGTCRMAHLSLPGSQLHVTHDPDRQPALAALLAAPDTHLLFPSPDATDVDALTRAPRTLVVVDGTWANARKLVGRSALLRALPRLSFRPEFASNYRIRREPEDHCLSTIEATAHVLERLERAPGRYTPMLSAFERMVDMQLQYVATRAGADRHIRHKPPPKPPVDPLAPLKAALDRLVLLHVEPNAWPYGTPDSPPVEAIELRALRIATGERFTTLLAPRQRLSPRVAHNLDLPEEAIHAGAPLSDTQAAWHQFLGPDAVLGIWGYHAVSLLRGEAGWILPPVLDLRALWQRAIGRAENLPDGRGRAPRRFAAIEQSLHALMTGACQ